MRRLLLLTLIAVSVLLAGAPAAAQMRVVTLSDVDISTPNGDTTIRPVDALFGTGGTVWVVDRYDYQSCSTSFPFCGASIVERVFTFSEEGAVAELGATEPYPYFFPPTFLTTTNSGFALDASAGHAFVLSGYGDVDSLSLVSVSGGVTTLASGGGDAPGYLPGDAPIGVFTDHDFADEIAVGRDGDLLFSARLSHGEIIDESNDSGIWRRSGDEVTLVAREGDPAPGAPGFVLGPIGPTRTTRIISLGEDVPTAPFAANSAAFAFQAKLSIPGYQFVGEHGIWADLGDGVELVVSTSQPAPGRPTGEVFAPRSTSFYNSTPSISAFSDPQVDGQGSVYFLAHSRITSGVSVQNNQYFKGLWRRSAEGVIDPIATIGPAADVRLREEGEEADWTEFNSFAVADSGYSGFIATVSLFRLIDDGFNSPYWENYEEDGVWVVDPAGEVDLVQLTQYGLDDSVSDDVSELSINEAGQVAFRTRRSDLVTSERWLSATGRDGSIVEILREGQSVDVGGGDERTVDRFTLEDFDAAGRLLLQVIFEDDTTALLVSEAVAAPSIHGDYNGDGLTNAADYDAWALTFGDEVRIGDGADGNLNGRVAAGDYTLWRDQMAMALAAAVPEPGAGALVLFAGLLAATRRR